MARAKKVIEATTDPLDTMLARLQLSGIRDQLDSLLDEAARANLSARETLILLCEREIAKDRKALVNVIAQTWNVPVKASTALVSGALRRQEPGG
ncbi:hypothetical protein [Bradyrhizobium erythrophlei]|uniref:hypothetical protein n=1 Tax=Bradyrhizobium erythrophlei TaxID=1437360 RepID=UPI000B05E126|nr:hypothetical protein [Bradyrhizobium erythrophlei]